MRNFSLYTKNKKIVEIDEFINNGVYCLAGANGLGKTTFLNAINYGLTGIVLEPNKEVLSPQEIITANKRYTNRYFEGRIKEQDKLTAEIELKFTINDKTFRIVRGFFEREELRVFELYVDKDGKKISQYDNSNSSPQNLNNDFQKLLAIEIGIEKFDYFIFYQLYVLTFDESRRMIFWDERASSHTMSIAFNTDLNDTDRIIKLKRRMDKHESDGRNVRWQATQLKNKIKTLQVPKDKESEDLDKLQEEYDKLYSQSEQINKEYQNIKIEYDTLIKKQSYINSDIMQLKMERTRLFSRYTEPRSKLVENIYIQQSIKKRECCLCGSNNLQIIETIQKNINKDKCPLCNTAINEETNEEQAKLLSLIEKNDLKISENNEKLENLILEADGKKVELEKAEYDLHKVNGKILGFTESYPDTTFRGTGNSSVDSIITQYQNQYDELDAEAKEEYKKRDELMPEYQELLTKTNNAYKEAEIEFVPIFRKLAKSFIGLDLNIRSERNNRSIYLVLELESTARTESFQLSESQRFFLDIALRMALSIYLSESNNPATMMIDTPEGSLDIAYESRVGTMFANFVSEYRQNLMMTANINASQLLISLAEKCSNKRMKFRRMLDWTDLSIVQKEGEHLFEKVYLNIEHALAQNNNE